MKKIGMLSNLLTALLLGVMAQAHANNMRFEEVECYEDGRPNIVKAKGYELLVRKSPQGCYFSINPNSTGEDSRSFQFGANGRLMASVDFSSQVASTRISGTSGTKNFDFVPKTNKQRAYIDPVSETLKVVTENGSEIFFDPKTGAIDEELTVDFEVKQEPVKAHRAGITLSNPKKTLITFPYKNGTPSTSNMGVRVFVESGSKTCSTKAANLFEYDILWLKGAKSPCPKGKTQCVLTGEKALKANALRADNVVFSVEATRPVADIESSLRSSCPGLYHSQAQKIQRKIAPKIMSKANAVIAKPELKPAPKPEFKPAPKLETKPKPEQKSEPKIQTAEIIPPASDCSQKLADYFSKEENAQKVGEYIRIQGKISLHRIAWTFMKSSEKDTRNIEALIQDLLKARDPELHQKLVDGKKLTRNEKLLEAMTVLKAESERYNESGKNLPYTLKFGDVKMLEMLVEAEKTHGRSAKNGVMDFVSIIRNSLKPRLGEKAANINRAQAEVKKLENLASSFESEVNAYLQSVGCVSEAQFGSCGNTAAGLEFDLGKSLPGNEKLLDAVYADFFDRDEELKANFKWGTYWLHVK